MTFCPKVEMRKHPFEHRSLPAGRYSYLWLSQPARPAPSWRASGVFMPLAMLARLWFAKTTASCLVVYGELSFASPVASRGAGALGRCAMYGRT